jgi:hypothetical protein
LLPVEHRKTDLVVLLAVLAAQASGHSFKVPSPARFRSWNRPADLADWQ